MIKLFLNVLFFTLLGSVIVYFFSVFNGRYISRVDYVNFITAARIVKNIDRTKIYDIPLQHSVQQDFISKFYKTDATLLFMNIPVVALFYLPLADAPMILGYRIMLLVSIFLIYLGVYLFYRKYLYKAGEFYSYAFMTLLSIPVFMCLVNVQITPAIIFLLLIGVYLSLMKKNYMLAGLFMGAVFLKPQYLTIAPFVFLLAVDKKKFVKGFLISFGIVLLLSISIVGINSFIGYFKYLIDTDIPQYAVNPEYIYSIHSVAKLLPFAFLKQGTTLFLIDLILYAAVFLLFMKKYAKIPLSLAYSLTIIICLPLAIHSFIQDLIILLIPLFVFFYEYKMGNRSNYLLFMIFFLMAFSILSFVQLSAWSSLFLFALGLIGLYVSYPKLSEGESMRAAKT